MCCGLPRGGFGPGRNAFGIEMRPESTQGGHEMEYKGSSMGIGLMGLAAVVCCVGPLLVIAVLPFILAAWATLAGQLTIAALIAALGIAGHWLFFYRRRGLKSAADCCAIPDKPGKTGKL